MKRSIRALMAAACIATLMAGEAQAQQVRENIPAMVFAASVGVTNRSTVEQQGSNNRAATVQHGQGNSASIRQFGRNNTGAITQNGDSNAACLIQIGRNLDGSITQTGNYNNVGVIQTRRGATEIPAEFCTANNGRLIARGIGRQIIQRAYR